MAKRVLHDKYFKLAKEDGYAARSAYKLKGINNRFEIIRRGDHVLDLGCSPGSWCQVACEVVGPKGLVVGIDLKPINTELPENCRTLVGDAFKTPVEELLADEEEGRLFDAVISDMAPNTSGAGDDLVSAHLCRDVLALLPRVLRPGGNLTMKIFEGAEYGDVLRETGRLFKKSKGHKPRATREVSREMFIVAAGYRPPERPAEKKSGPPEPAPGWFS